MKYLAKHSLLVILIISILIYFILTSVFNIENISLNAGMAGAIAVVLSPRKKKIQTQTGEKTQITWFFLKEAIILD